MTINLDFSKKIKVLNKIQKVSQSIVALKDKRGHQGMFTSLPALMTVLKPYLGEYKLHIETHREVVNGVPYVVVAVIDLESGEYTSTETVLEEVEAKTPLMKEQAKKAGESFFVRTAILGLFNIVAQDNDRDASVSQSRYEMRDKSDIRKFEVIEQLENYPTTVMSLLKDNQPLTLQELPYSVLQGALEDAKKAKESEQVKKSGLKIQNILRVDVENSPNSSKYIEALGKMGINEDTLNSIIAGANKLILSEKELFIVHNFLEKRLGEKYDIVK